MKTTVVRFQLQPTASFPEGAPDRAEYLTDEGFIEDCDIYAVEWATRYEHPGKCKNRDCPQCWPITKEEHRIIVARLFGVK